MENVCSVKASNGLRTMFVKDILFELTDETHLITVGEILEVLESRYGIITSRKTIYDDIEMLINSGFDIECVSGKNNRHMYHVLNREFDLAEIRILIDAIESLKSLSGSKSMQLIKKLSMFTGPSYEQLIKDVDVFSRPKTDNPKIYYIIDTVYKAINTRKKIAFKYYEYLTSANKPLKNNGEDYHISPYRLVCSNDYYYLLGFSDKHQKITAFRIDLICGIPSELDEDCVVEPEEFSANTYIKDAFHMKSGESSDVLLEFDSSVIDAMVDRFGNDLTFTYMNKSTCRAKVNVQVNNVFFAWIFGFDGKVRITGSRDVQNQYIRMVAKEMARL